MKSEKELSKKNIKFYGWSAKIKRSGFLHHMEECKN